MVTLRNESLVKTIAETIVDNLWNHAKHQCDPREVLFYMENVVYDRSIVHDEMWIETFDFDEVWGIIVNSELEEVYDTLTLESQVKVREYVKDRFPDWRVYFDLGYELP